MQMSKSSYILFNKNKRYSTEFPLQENHQILNPQMTMSSFSVYFYLLLALVYCSEFLFNLLCELNIKLIPSKLTILP